MPRLKDTPYIAYDFTMEESDVAYVFIDLNYKHIQTELAIVASERLLCSMNPNSPNPQLEYLMTQEYLRGKAEALQGLLVTSDNTTEEVRQRNLAAAEAAQAEERRSKK